MNIINKIVAWFKTLIGCYEYFNGFYYPRTVGYDKHHVAHMFNSGMSLGDICHDGCNFNTECDGISCKKCMFSNYGRPVLLEFLQHEGLVKKEDN